MSDCVNPDHGGAVTCADCAKAREAEHTALNDRYMRLLGERSTWERDIKAVYRSRYQDDLNAFGAFYAAAAMSKAASRLARLAWMASRLAPAMALARHREYVTAVQQAGAEALSWAIPDDEHAAAERLWGEWRAENTRLRALVRQAARALHVQGGAPAGGCRCPGCEVIRDMDAVPVTAEDDGLPVAVTGAAPRRPRPADGTKRSSATAG